MAGENMSSEVLDLDWVFSLSGNLWELLPVKIYFSVFFLVVGWGIAQYLVNWLVLSVDGAGIHELVTKYQEGRSEYEKDSYNETSTREDFISPMLRALGWDVENREQRRQSLRTVKQEWRRGTGYPDYILCIDGVDKVVIEVKKPSVNVNSPAHSLQARRYAWNSQIPVAILTNFKDVVVFDGTTPPQTSDGTMVGRIHEYCFTTTGTNFDDRWEDFRRIFSFQSLEDGIFDDDSLDRGTRAQTVDNALVRMMLQARRDLAAEIYEHNTHLPLDGHERESDEYLEHLRAVSQVLVHRILLLRAFEDYGLEEHNQLRRISNLPATQRWNRLVELFERCATKYNTDMFDFDVDEVTQNLVITPEGTHRLLNSFYNVDAAQYDFRFIPLQVLGHSYEKYLAQIIDIQGSDVVGQDSPYVTRAGGVYYTESYVSTAQVHSTMSEWRRGRDNLPRKIWRWLRLDFKEPEVVGKKLSILDPACGSGSYLIEAYSYLLDSHLEHYTRSILSKLVYRSKLFYRGEYKWYNWFTESSWFDSESEGGWTLCFEERKRILEQHIYGVDLDHYAVQMTKLSLYMKLLTDTGEELRSWVNLNDLLPDLNNNILFQNSLIGEDYTGGDRAEVSPFDWGGLNEGRFDIIIGNPPWGAISTPDEEVYLRQRHGNIYTEERERGNAAYYFLLTFLPRLRSGGLLSFLLPDGLFNQTSKASIRAHVHREYSINNLAFLGDVFVGASMPCGFIIVGGRKPLKQKAALIDLNSELTEDGWIQYTGARRKACLAPGAIKWETMELPSEGGSWLPATIKYAPVIAKISNNEGVGTFSPDIARKVFRGVNSECGPGPVPIIPAQGAVTILDPNWQAQVEDPNNAGEMIPNPDAQTHVANPDYIPAVAARTQSRKHRIGEDGDVDTANANLDALGIESSLNIGDTETVIRHEIQREGVRKYQDFCPDNILLYVDGEVCEHLDDLPNLVNYMNENISPPDNTNAAGRRLQCSDVVRFYERQDELVALENAVTQAEGALLGINQQNNPDEYATAQGTLADATTARNRWRSSGHHPFRLHRPRSRELYDDSLSGVEKIIVALTGDYIKATINRGNLWTDTNTVTMLENPEDAIVITGILNSRIISSIHRMKNPDLIGRVMSQLTVKDVEDLPFPLIRDDLGDLAIDSDQYDSIASAVTQIQDSLRILDAQPTGEVRIQQRRNIDQMVDRIDDIVLSILGITDEEECRVFIEASGDIPYYQ